MTSMNKTSKPMGRPTLRIDSERLRALRTEAGLTQLELAKRVYARAGREKSTSADVMKNSAQRWEAHGAVPPETAQHLAAVLKTTVAVLQGGLPEPAPSRLDEIESHLRQLVLDGPPATLSEALEYYKLETNPAHELAKVIASRIEFAQLTQAQQEFEEIEAMTGLSAHELREPTSFIGFWMFIGIGPIGPERSEILSGITDVMSTVRTEMTGFFAQVQESDACVSFSKDGQWFQVTMRHPRLRQLNRVLRFVRCQPKENGLQWTAPAWRDKFWLDALPRDAYQYANFISDFDGVQVPTDCTNLRFAVTKAAHTPEQFEALCLGAKPEIGFLTSGNLQELHPRAVASFKREGNLHHLVVNRLASDLWDKLLPFLTEWPLECWSFRSASSRIDVMLDVPFRLYAKSQNPLKFGHRFSVSLVEMTAEGELKPAPWREASVSEIHLLLTKSLLTARQEQANSTPQAPTA